MNYQNYDEYMKNVLGYSPYEQSNYYETQGNFYLGGFPEDEQTFSDFTSLYPEIYNMVYPMICKTCSIHMNKSITNELLEKMTEEIYNNIEPEDSIPVRTPLKNGDVRNPNSKDPELQLKETRHTNYLLRDLIKILLLREWEKPARPPFVPPMPPRPGMGPRPPVPPMQRPRYY